MDLGGQQIDISWFRILRKKMPVTSGCCMPNFCTCSVLEWQHVLGSPVVSSIIQFMYCLIIRGTFLQVFIACISKPEWWSCWLLDFLFLDKWFFADGFPSFECPRCDRNYSVPSTLERHLKYECGVPKQFECGVCRRKFSRRDILRCHQKTFNH